MVFSVRVDEPEGSYHTEIEALSAEDAIRKLTKARKDAPVRFVFLRHQPSAKAGVAHRPQVATS